MTDEELALARADQKVREEAIEVAAKALARLQGFSNNEGYWIKEATAAVDAAWPVIEAHGEKMVYRRRIKPQSEVLAAYKKRLHEGYVKTESGCWEWQKLRDKAGYGRVCGGPRKRRSGPAHRAVYEDLVGPIPEGLVLDHLCRNPPCVNPDHLEPVTNRDNLWRSPLFNGRKTHCKHGHEFTGENLLYGSDGRRICRACRVRANKAGGERRNGASVARCGDVRPGQSWRHRLREGLVVVVVSVDAEDDGFIRTDQGTRAAAVRKGTWHRYYEPVAA